MQGDQTNPNTNPNPAQPTYVSPKSSTVAGVLGIFLGSFGAHDWYLGDNKKGMIHVALFGGGFLISLIGACLTALSAGIPIIAVLFGLIAMLGYIVLLGNSIWGLIEGIIILAQGDAGLAAKGYPIAVPQVYVQNPANPQPAAQPTQPVVNTEDKVVDTPAPKATSSKASTAKDTKATKKSDDKKTA